MSHDISIERLSISVQPSPETNDHEVLLRSEEGDLIERFGDMMIGLDPDDILVEPCPLLPGDTPHPAVIGRCDCGVIGCGSVEVTIASDGQLVAWTSERRTIGVRFDVAQYTAEVQRALHDHSWETPDRTAARLIKTSVDRERLAESGLELEWASGRVGSNTMTISLRLVPGPYQLLVHVPWAGEPPEALAELCCRLLGENPRWWSDVEWLPQATGLGRPRIAGRGWRLWKR